MHGTAKAPVWLQPSKLVQEIEERLESVKPWRGRLTDVGEDLAIFAALAGELFQALGVHGQDVVIPPV